MFANSLPQRSSSELQHRRCQECSLITATEAPPGWSVLQAQSQGGAYSTDKSANIENGISNRQFRRANFISTNTSYCFVYHASSFGAMRENRESSAIPAIELEP